MWGWDCRGWVVHSWALPLVPSCYLGRQCWVTGPQLFGFPVSAPTAYPVGLSLYHPLTSKCHCPALFPSPVFHPVSPTLATHLPAHQQPHQLLARTRGTPEHWVGGAGRCEPVSREIPQLLGWRPAGGQAGGASPAPASAPPCGLPRAGLGRSPSTRREPLHGIPSCRILGGR